MFSKFSPLPLPFFSLSTVLVSVMGAWEWGLMAASGMSLCSVKLILNTITHFLYTLLNNENAI